jgi:hypothetical protein
VKPIVLSSDAYTKRTRLFVDGVWVDAKPLVIGRKDMSSKEEIQSTPIKIPYDVGSKKKSGKTLGWLLHSDTKLHLLFIAFIFLYLL